jgi:hypothetical protein
LKVTDTTVALAAFFLSVAIVGSGLISSMKGPEVDVVPPEQVLLYKSGAVLDLAIRLPMINNASGYNDLVTSARLQLGGMKRTFPLSEIAIPVFNDESDAGAQKVYCEPTLRCQTFSKMAISQRAETVVTVPAGGAHSDYYSFELYCDDDPQACRGFANFEAAVESLRGMPLTLRIWLDLHRDGRRLVTCVTAPIEESHLIANGWQTLECDTHSAREI